MRLECNLTINCWSKYDIKNIAKILIICIIIVIDFFAKHFQYYFSKFFQKITKSRFWIRIIVVLINHIVAPSTFKSG